MFEKAARMKLRFEYKGVATVEDLWDLKVEELDGIYRKLRVQQKETSGESLLTPPAGNDDLNLRVDIVKRIVSVKQAETEARADRATKLMRRRRIADIIAQKQEQSLMDKSEEELGALLAEMEAEMD
jgi:hypothetical protein